jgi:hypothetical protein
VNFVLLFLIFKLMLIILQYKSRFLSTGISPENFFQIIRKGSQIAICWRF